MNPESSLNALKSPNILKSPDFNLLSANINDDKNYIYKLSPSKSRENPD